MTFVLLYVSLRYMYYSLINNLFLIDTIIIYIIPVMSKTTYYLHIRNPITHSPTFEIPFHRISYCINNPIYRIARECNNLKKSDLFMNDLYSL